MSMPRAPAQVVGGPPPRNGVTIPESIELPEYSALADCQETRTFSETSGFFRTEG